MIRVGVIGYGYWGPVVARNFHSVDGCQLAMVCDANPAALERAQKAYPGIPVTANAGDVVRSPAVDVVAVITPVWTHFEFAKAALENGKHVFVEKPFTLDRAGAKAAMDECEKAKIAVGIGFNRRFMPAFAEMKRLIASGELGTILHIEGNASGNLAAIPPSAWRANRTESPGGGMTSLAIHLMDAMIWMCGPIRIIDAKSSKRVMPYDMDDTTSMLLTFVNGTTGYLGTVAATPFFMNLRVFGSKGWAQLVDNNTLVKAIPGPAEPGQNPYATKPETLTFDSQVSIKAELEAFADAAEGKAAFPISHEEIVHAASAFQSMLDSVRRGSPCSVD